MKTICIASIYFGKLPNTFEFWMNSVRYNRSINFLLFTDCKVKNEWMIPGNLKIVSTTFDKIRERFQSLFDFKITLDQPYKLCDYRPAFGMAFKDYFEGYDMWGYADLDLVFGNLRYFFTEEILTKYDKIYHQGHLSLYRNCREMNELFQREIPDGGAYDYKFVYTTKHPCFFDEACGMERIAQYYDVKVWHWGMGLEQGVLVDVAPFEKRFVFRYNGIPLTNVYLKFDSGALELCSDEMNLTAVYAHFAKRVFSVCLLHNKNTESCKTKLEKIASPFWRKLQSVSADPV